MVSDRPVTTEPDVGTNARLKPSKRSELPAIGMNRNRIKIEGANPLPAINCVDALFDIAGHRQILYCKF